MMMDVIVALVRRHHHHHPLAFLGVYGFIAGLADQVLPSETAGFETRLLVRNCIVVRSRTARSQAAISKNMHAA